MPPFDFSCVDWSDDDANPFDECDTDCSELQSSCCYEALERRQRVISFAEEEELHEIPSLEEYSLEEKQAAFYSKSEFSTMRTQAQQVLLLLENSIRGVSESDTFTSRGLECRTDMGGRKRTHNRREAYHWVFSEQERQWRCGENDTERIATVYKAVSCNTTANALMSGVEDEQAVQDYLQDARAQLHRLFSENNNASNDTCTKEDYSDDCSCSCITKPEENRIGAAAAITKASMFRRVAVLEDIKLLNGAAAPSLLELHIAISAAA